MNFSLSYRLIIFLLSHQLASYKKWNENYCKRMDFLFLLRKDLISYLRTHLASMMKNKGFHNCEKITISFIT